MTASGGHVNGPLPYPLSVTDDTDMDAIVAELAAAGLLTIGHDAEGRETWTLTPAGEQVANQIAMSTEDDGVALLTALLDVASETSEKWPAPERDGPAIVNVGSVQPAGDASGDGGSTGSSSGSGPTGSPMGSTAMRWPVTSPGPSWPTGRPMASAMPAGGSNV